MNRSDRTTAAVLSVVLAAAAVSVAEPAEVVVDASIKHQTVHGFGTCMKSWGSREKDPVARQQYNPEIHKMYVEDLGFSMVRIPMHLWVLEAENPYGIPTTATPEMIADPTKITYRAFSWENPGRAAGRPKYAIDWAKAMVALNPEIKVFGSVWSPPNWMKEPAPRGPGKKFHWSKYGACSCGGRLNPKFYTHYGHYLAEWVKGMKTDHGIDLYAISIQNELGFYEPYDSCVYTPAEFAAAIKEIGRVFDEMGIDTKLMGPEDMTKFPKRCMSFVEAAMADPGAAKALDVVCSHGYTDGIETSVEAGDAAALWKLMQRISPGREYWMTETGGGGGGWDDIETVWQSGKRKGQKRIIPGALSGLATMQHNALVHGNASVWTTWQFLGGKNAFVHVTMESATPTRKYYVQKHYSRYVVPDSRRIEATAPAEQGLLVSAYQGPDGATWTVVLQNHAEQPRPIRLKIGPDAPKTYQAYVTDRGRNCEPSGRVTVGEGAAGLTLPPRSIMTLTGSR